MSSAPAKCDPFLLAISSIIALRTNTVTTTPPFVQPRIYKDAPLVHRVYWSVSTINRPLEKFGGVAQRATRPLGQVAQCSGSDAIAICLAGECKTLATARGSTPAASQGGREKKLWRALPGPLLEIGMGRPKATGALRHAGRHVSRKSESPPQGMVPQTPIDTLSAQPAPPILA